MRWATTNLRYGLAIGFFAAMSPMFANCGPLQCSPHRLVTAYQGPARRRHNQAQLLPASNW